MRIVVKLWLFLHLTSPIAFVGSQMLGSRCAHHYVYRRKSYKSCLFSGFPEATVQNWSLWCWKYLELSKSTNIPKEMKYNPCKQITEYSRKFYFCLYAYCFFLFEMYFRNEAKYNENIIFFQNHWVCLDLIKMQKIQLKIATTNYLFNNNLILVIDDSDFHLFSDATQSRIWKEQSIWTSLKLN